METFSVLLAICAGNSPATGEFPAQRPVTRSFDVFFYLRLNERLNKQSWGWWFATPSHPLYPHSNGLPFPLPSQRRIKVSWQRCGGASWLNWWLTPTLRWRHNECDGVSNHQPQDCLLNRLSRRRSKDTSKLRVTGLCEGNSAVTIEFPSQRASDAENVSIWWRHYAYLILISVGVWGTCRLPARSIVCATYGLWVNKVRNYQIFICISKWSLDFCFKAWYQ